MQSCIIPRLPTYFVQELNVGIVDTELTEDNSTYPTVKVTSHGSRITIHLLKLGILI